MGDILVDRRKVGINVAGSTRISRSAVPHLMFNGIGYISSRKFAAPTFYLWAWHVSGGDGPSASAPAFTGNSTERIANSMLRLRLLIVPVLSENGGQQDPADISGRVPEGPRNLNLWMAPHSPLSALVFIADQLVRPESLGLWSGAMLSHAASRFMTLTSSDTLHLDFIAALLMPLQQSKLQPEQPKATRVSSNQSCGGQNHYIRHRSAEYDIRFKVRLAGVRKTRMPFKLRDSLGRRWLLAVAFKVLGGRQRMATHGNGSFFGRTLRQIEPQRRLLPSRAVPLRLLSFTEWISPGAGGPETGGSDSGRRTHSSNVPQGRKAKTPPTLVGALIAGCARY
ncbi:hypothetical protein CMEL01_09919 [Colletotrichum melonis]|uniref:Uncharacterized protein n=1 Tax=Colletotrichum melonis TaxID=1209925 RepID=A0AAI9TU80_9PEZI|nr:hypothetical protein CMEL01_09919 [Colletotrichum melonis]